MRQKTEWHNEAKRMRIRGASMKDIATKFGVTPSAVSLICKDVYCPVNHKSIAKQAQPTSLMTSKIDEVVDYWESGRNTFEIGILMQISEAQVCRILPFAIEKIKAAA